MLHFRFRFTLALSLAATCLAADAPNYQWPSPQYDTLEALLYEGRRGDGSNLASIQHPCRNRPDSNASVGGEWLRFAFHDMATHDVGDGSGGLDGSIVYELDRPENFGNAFTRSLSDFEVYPNKYISRADVISVAAVFAVASCGGPIIPFRGGRVDTWKAGNTGTPEPQQDIATHTEMFRRSGFNAQEMIKMVACGHTMGSVRSTDFPDMVPPGPNPAVARFINFDSTPEFDNLVVTEYLDGTTQNPLVIDANKTMVSDLRIFSLDSNDTMRSIASPDAFTTECQNILERMINVVPHGVSLTEEITLLPVKVHDVQLTFERNKLVFKSSLRLLQPIDTKLNKDRVVTMLWCDRNGDAKNCKGTMRTSVPSTTLQEDPDLSPMTRRQNYNFVNYNFVVPIDGSQSISKFWFEVDEKDGKPATVHNNGGNGYVVEQDQVLFVPTLSRADAHAITKRGGFSGSNDTFTKTYTIVAAVRDGSNPSRIYVDAHDFAIHQFPTPLNTTVDLKSNSSIPASQGYSFYSATLEDKGFQLTLDLHSVGSDGKTYTEDFRQTTFLDNTPYYAPTAVTNTAKSSSPSWRLIDEWHTIRQSICGSLVVGLLLRTLL